MFEGPKSTSTGTVAPPTNSGGNIRADRTFEEQTKPTAPAQPALPSIPVPPEAATPPPMFGAANVAGKKPKKPPGSFLGGTAASMPQQGQLGLKTLLGQ